MQFGVYINMQLRIISRLYRGVQDYIENGRDKMLVDPDPDEISMKRKARFSSAVPNDHVSPVTVTSSVKYPSDGWGKSLERMHERHLLRFSRVVLLFAWICLLWGTHQTAGLLILDATIILDLLKRSVLKQISSHPTRCLPRPQFLL